MKDAGAYYIIREMHLWEMDHGPEENSDKCEELVQVIVNWLILGGISTELYVILIFVFKYLYCID